MAPVHLILFTSFLFGMPWPELELQRLYQMEGVERRFDLSGLVQVDGNLYAISDKDWDHFIYQIELKESTFAINGKNKLQLGATADRGLDLEGIDYCSDTFYLINEKGNYLLAASADGNVRRIDLDYSPVQENPSKWSRNAGLEGVAIDCENRVLYLAKERDPRFLIEVDMSTGKATRKFDLDNGNLDIADLKFENGHLYVLERNAFQVTKVDLSTLKIVESLSYGKTGNPSEGKLFEPAKYGMAEALLLTDDQVLIGLDNNGVRVSDHAQDKYDVSGTGPIILVFDRPKGF